MHGRMRLCGQFFIWFMNALNTGFYAESKDRGLKVIKSVHFGALALSTKT